MRTVLPVTRHAARGTRRARSGAMAAELALLTAFVYVPLIFGAIYVGWLATARQRVHESNHYSIWAWAKNEHDPLYNVRDTHFREFTGQATVKETDPTDADVPGSAEIHDMFEAFTNPIHYRNVSAHGGFYLDGSTVRYHESVNIDEGYHVRPEGQLVEAWHLLDDQIPEGITDLLVDYLHRRQAHTNYIHSWKEHTQEGDRVFDSDKVVAGDDKVAAWNLQVPNDATATKDEWSPEAAVRWTKVRMASSLPGALQLTPVDMPLPLPAVESDYDYWHPCEGWLNIVPPPSTP